MKIFFNIARAIGFRFVVAGGIIVVIAEGYEISGWGLTLAGVGVILWLYFSAKIQKHYPADFSKEV